MTPPATGADRLVPPQISHAVHPSTHPFKARAPAPQAPLARTDTPLAPAADGPRPEKLWTSPYSVWSAADAESKVRFAPYCVEAPTYVPVAAWGLVTVPSPLPPLPLDSIQLTRELVNVT